MEEPSRFDQAASAALRRASVVGAVAAIAIGVLLAILVSIILGVVVMVLCSAAWVLWVQREFSGAAEKVVAPLGSEVPEDELPGLRNAIEGVALLTGVEEPVLRLIDSPTANAMVAADRDFSTVVVTSGLLEAHPTVEVEVLAAEMLCRLRDGSARYTTVAAGLSPLMRRVSGMTPADVAATLGDQRATRGDMDAVSVTRYPPGLISAFESMTERGTAVRGVAPETAPLWIAPAVGTDAGVDPAVDRTTNQSLDYRISVLREL